MGRRELGVNPALLETTERMIPPGRAGSPAEAAGAVYLLCRPESDCVGDQTLVCAGGLSA